MKLQSLLETYAPDLWAKDAEQIEQGAWPQYYIGAYPYCFRLPKYTPAKWPPAPTAVTDTPHTAGAGSHEHDEAADPGRPLIMGQAPGTHWYHAHKHGSTTINVRNGMTGILILEDNSPTGYDGFIDRAYKDYPGFKEQVILINQLGTAPGLERGGGGGPGPHFSVNGRLKPKITMKGGEVQLWRLANNSSRAGVYIIEPATTTSCGKTAPANAPALSWKQTAQDGVQFVNANYRANLTDPVLIGAGNRVDLLVKVPALAQGQKSATYNVCVYNTVDPTDRPPFVANAVSEALLTVQVDANGTDMPFMANAPPFPPFLQDITDKEIQGTKELVFASTAPGAAPIANHPAQHTIDGKKFDGEVGVSVRMNKVEEWKVINKTFAPNQISHPFHIHINPFQISELFDPSAVLSTTAGAAGTSVTTTNGSNVVTGNGTSFLADAKVGDFIWIDGEKPATVLSIASDTSLTFSINAAGVTNATYTLGTPLYTIDKNSTDRRQCYIDPAQESSWKPCTATEPARNRVWWDVFNIPSGNIFYANGGATTYEIYGWFKMRSRFVDYAGHFVLHCHILAHEDRGMMTVVEVSPLQPPYSHK